MLRGIATDDNPLLINPGAGKEMPIVFEDEHLVVVNKPHDLLSVPGINIEDSVYARLKTVDTDPIVVHRLDMATSGLLVMAKTKEAHYHLQQQFLKRTVVKRYTALLSKRLGEDKTEGEINLPLRGNIDDLPRQLVCFEHGKKAVTRFKIVARNDNTTKIHFWPLTGRSHQLRMHAAHQLGLDAPIVGDDLYGTSADRLHLHAAYLEFVHPVTKEVMKFEVAENF